MKIISSLALRIDPEDDNLWGFCCIKACDTIYCITSKRNNWICEFNHWNLEIFYIVLVFFSFSFLIAITFFPTCDHDYLRIHSRTMQQVFILIIFFLIIKKKYSWLYSYRRYYHVFTLNSYLISIITRNCITIKRNEINTI